MRRTGLYFVLKESGGVTAQKVAGFLEGDLRLPDIPRFIHYIANHACAIKVAVSLRQIKTLIKNPFPMTHARVRSRFAVQSNGPQTISPLRTCLLYRP
jgi:hypothetical protein